MKKRFLWAAVFTITLMVMLFTGCEADELPSGNAAGGDSSIQDVETTPFQQKYWVIFTEGYRDDRLEASAIDSSLPADQLSIIWNGDLELNDTSGSDDCEQYYLDENGEWVYIGSYHRLSDNATHVISSNLDVVDVDGNVIISGIPYSMIDWDEIERYR